MVRARLPSALPSLLLAAAIAAVPGACRRAEPSPVAAPAAAASSAAAPSTATAPAAPADMAAAIDALDPLPGPKDAVRASMRKFLALQRYHASMQVEGGPRGAMASEIDFVAPDRYRMRLQGLGTQTVVGDTLYMEVGGRTMKVPLPAGTPVQWRDPLQLAGNEAATTVQAQGRDRIDGETARKYLVHHEQPQAVDVTLWIGSDDLPLQVRVAGVAQGHAHTTTIRYSRFDDPAIEVQPPR
jgi:hypothetical protein